MAERYGADGAGSTAKDQAYANAMRTVSHKYPDDLDVQTLFAESLMDLHPWRLWSIDGPARTRHDRDRDHARDRPPRRTPTISAPTITTGTSMQVEASPSIPRARWQAPDRLGALARWAPGHLVHMPSHIYIRTGRFHDAAETNASAIKADQAFFAKSKEGGVYPLVYYTHNIHFLCYAQMIEGRQHDALASARMLETKVPLDAVRAMPMAEFLVPMPYLVETRFGLWNTILKEPAPAKDLPFTSAMWHYARALAFSAKGNRAQAASEQKQLAAIAAAIPPDRPLGTSNRAKDVAEVAVVVVDGELASARGDHAGRRGETDRRRAHAGRADLRGAANLVLPGARVARRATAGDGADAGRRNGLSRRPENKPRQSALALRTRAMPERRGQGRRGRQDTRPIPQCVALRRQRTDSAAVGRARTWLGLGDAASRASRPYVSG